MKKPIIICILALLILLAACSAKETKNSIVDNNSYYQPSKKMITEDQNAYFIISRGLLNYTDKKTNQSYLLGEQSLTLEDVYKLNLLDQYALTKTSFNFIFAYSDYLYLVQGSKYEDQQSFYKLHRFDKTGKSKKTILEFSNYFPAICIGEKSLYFIDNKYTKDNQKIILLARYNLEESKQEEDLVINPKYLEGADHVTANQINFYQNKVYISIFTLTGSQGKKILHIIDLENNNEHSLLLADTEAPTENDEVLRPSSFCFWQDKIVFNVSPIYPSKDSQNFVYTSNLDGSDYQEWFSLPKYQELFSNGEKLVKIDHKEASLSNYQNGEFEKSYNLDAIKSKEDGITYALDSSGNLFQYNFISRAFAKHYQAGKGNFLFDLSEYLSIPDLPQSE